MYNADTSGRCRRVCDHAVTKKHSPTSGAKAAKRSATGSKGPEQVLHALAKALEADLRKTRQELTEQLYRRAGPFWDAIQALRVRWRIEPRTEIPPAEMVVWNGASFHVPMSCLVDTARLLADEPLDDPVAGYAELHAAVRRPLADWLRDLTDLYERTVPLSERQRERQRTGPMLPNYDQWRRFPEFGPRWIGGDAFTDHWAPFLSGCALFQPPADDLRGFADHIRVAPESLIRAWRETPIAARPRITPPGLAFLRDPDTVEEAERSFWVERISRLAKKYKPLGLDLFADLRNVHDEMSAELGEQIRSGTATVPEGAPYRPLLDPVQARNQEIVTKARSLVTKGRPGRPRIHPIEVAQVAAHEERGLTELEIAERMDLKTSPDSYDRLRRSNQVRSRRKRNRELVADQEKPAE